MLQRIGNVRWGIAGLLGTGIVINYLDRVNISVATQPFEHEFHSDADRNGHHPLRLSVVLCPASGSSWRAAGSIWRHVAGAYRDIYLGSGDLYDGHCQWTGPRDSVENPAWRRGSTDLPRCRQGDGLLVPHQRARPGNVCL